MFTQKCSATDHSLTNEDLRMKHRRQSLVCWLAMLLLLCKCSIWTGYVIPSLGTTHRSDLKRHYQNPRVTRTPVDISGLDPEFCRRLSGFPLGLHLNSQRDCQNYETKLECRMRHNIPISISQFHVLFDGLNRNGDDIDMRIRHHYYSLMIIKRVLPNTHTFNLLLRGVFYSNPPRFKFIGFFMDQMAKLKIKADERTIVELMFLCARYPYSTNQKAADSWFYGEYVPRIVQNSNGTIDKLVVNAYSAVYVASGDPEGAKRIEKWAAYYRCNK